jgi:hypothetical protein
MERRQVVECGPLWAQLDAASAIRAETPVSAAGLPI